MNDAAGPADSLPADAEPAADCPCRGSNLDRFIQPAILAVLAGGERHGYQILEELSSHPLFAAGKPDTGGLYRTLNNMEARGLCISRWDTSTSGPARRRYTITPSGRICLGRWVETLEAFSLTVGRLAGFCQEALAHSPAKPEPKVP